jgi:YaiO family outer membrane protein
MICRLVDSNTLQNLRKNSVSPIDNVGQITRYAEEESLLRQQINVKPTNWDAHFRLAKVLSWQKKFAEAESEYQMLLAREPGNADYLVGLAQVFVWRGDARVALPLIERAQLRASGDPDVWRLHIQALAALNDETSLKQALIVQQQAAERFPELDWAIVTSETPTVTIDNQQASTEEFDRGFNLAHKNQLELGGSYDQLSKNRGFWRSEYLSVEHRFAPRELVYGNFSQTERFRLNDVQFLLGGYYPLSSKLTLNLEGNVSPSPQVLASNSIMASLQGGLGQGWFLTGGYRHSEYNTGPLQQGFAILENYFSDFRVAYTPRITDSQGKAQFGHRFDVSYYYQDTSFITLTYNMGAETTGFQGQVLDTQFFGLNGRHWFNQDWALNWALGHTIQGNAYNREGVSLGLRRTF